MGYSYKMTAQELNTAFKEFHNYRRSSDEKYTDFVITFEKLYSRVVKYKMILPEEVKAYFLLNAANMSEDNEKLAMTTRGKLTY